MAFLSNGVLTKSSQVMWQGNTAQIDNRFFDLLGTSWAYDQLYRSNVWVYTPVNKIAGGIARLPLKIYERSDSGRLDASDSPYGRLLRRPNRRIPPKMFWFWARATKDIYGESFLGKLRDNGGRPVELVPLHPTWMSCDKDTGLWTYNDGRNRFVDIPRRDLVHFAHYNPGGARGLSPLEPLRATLENEHGARAANSALWRNGGRPSVMLEHPAMLSDRAFEQLAVSWKDVHGGVDNWGKAVILEEGMKANIVPLNVEELQYVEARRLNREEVCAVYDIPPPALHILDRATFSNITEQMRSLYRDTMAPKVGQLESTLEHDLRDGSFGVGSPDFGEEFYAEFLMDEVMRGDFEVRTTAYSTAINGGWMMPSEVRQLENLPYVEGSDTLVMNSTLVPISDGSGDTAMSPRELAEALQKIYLAVGKVISAEEAREILNRDGAGLTGPPPMLELPSGAPKAVPAPTVRSVMGRIRRAKSLADIDPGHLVAGFDDPLPVLDALHAAVTAGETVDLFRARLRALTEGTP